MTNPLFRRSTTFAAGARVQYSYTGGIKRLQGVTGTVVEPRCESSPVQDWISVDFGALGIFDVDAGNLEAPRGGRVSDEILACQQAYAARPVAVHWRHSHAAGTHRFDTLEDAFAYVDQQWTTIRNRVRSERYCAPDLRRCYLEAPGIGRLPMHLVLLADDVSSY